VVGAVVAIGGLVDVGAVAVVLGVSLGAVAVVVGVVATTFGVTGGSDLAHAGNTATVTTKGAASAWRRRFELIRSR
jgi:hypothetical protein